MTLRSTILITSVATLGGCSGQPMARTFDVGSGCDGSTAASLDQLWTSYLSDAPTSTRGGCAQSGCHLDGAGKLQFSSASQFAAATVNVAAFDPVGTRVVPGHPLDSIVYQRLAGTGSAEQMPPGGPYLTSDDLREVAGWICAGAPAASSIDGGVPGDGGVVSGGDTTPPTFGGATSATPSPNAITLDWSAATDNVTSSSQIIYLVYQASTAGGESFNTPTFTTPPGVTSLAIGKLPINTRYYFVVRARDAAGNVDKNKTIVNSKPGPDVTPPVFAGCTGAVAKDAGSIAVTWGAATDDVAPSSAIAYDLYASSSPGAENFTKPNNTYTGVTSGLVTGLTSGTKWYIVCRAKDATGNEDKNTAEVSDTTLVDTVPPVFTGITTVDNLVADGATLHWVAATDDKSDPSDIVYVVYQRDQATPGYPTTPTTTSPPGVTKLDVKGLGSAKSYCWNVHAKDGAGNEDKNTAEQCATTQVSFETGVQPIFTLHCAVTGCHVGPSPTGGMVLADGFAYSYTVNVTSGENPPMKRIAPGDSTNSYLYQKITGHPAAGTSVMPPSTTGDVLSDADKNTILQWILEGAPNN